jgi:hypothetical protein
MRFSKASSAVLSLLAWGLTFGLAPACEGARQAPPSQTPPGPPPPGQPYYYPPYASPYPAPSPPPPPYVGGVGGASPAYSPGPSSTAASPPPGPAARSVLPGVSRPLLGALAGPAAWQEEVRAVARELIGHLSSQNASRVAPIPLVFDPNPYEINAFAGCDESGAPFVAGTEGLLEAVDGIAQSKATDELFGTQTYGAYVGVVAPRLVSSEGGSAAFPAGIIAPQYWLDPRRISRAHEIFDEIVAFTFGHELSHHYLGHTGCASGQAAGAGPAIAQLSQLATAIIPGLNQPNEIMADTNGCINTLDTGRARASVAYRWNEEGGLWLLDFFSRLEAASGDNPLLGFLRTHPNPGLRIPIVQTVAATWRFRNPG